MQRLRRWFQRVVLARRWLTFLVMVASFIAFGAGTLNLFFVVRANSAFLIENGWMAVMDGGLRQSAELLLSAAVSMLACLVFKTCEHRLVHWLGEPEAKD